MFWGSGDSTGKSILNS